MTPANPHPLFAPRPVERAPVQWYGGKGNLKAWLLPLIPAGGRPYLEPFGGAGSILFARDPAPVETYNDLHGDLVNLMRCLQDRALFDDLKHRLTWTLYSREEFGRALEIRDSDETDPVLRAWATFVALNQGFSGTAVSLGDWSRKLTSSCGGMSEATNKWLMRLAMLDAWRLRLQRVQIDSRPACQAIAYWDGPEAVIYCDPPYPHATRAEGKRAVYDHEMTDDQHLQLIETLLECQGAVVLSSYPGALTDPLADAGWQRLERRTAANAAGRVRGSGLQGKGAAMAKVPRTEVVWRNPRAVAMSPHRDA